jgi:hypothetical protein
MIFWSAALSGVVDFEAAKASKINTFSSRHGILEKTLREGIETTRA